MANTANRFKSNEVHVPRVAKVRSENIPAELKGLRQWVCWRWEKLDEKWTKPPVNARTGGSASHGDPATWSTFAEALAAHQKNSSRFHGIGFVFTQNDPYAGVDLDDCRDPETGHLDAWALKIVRTLNSYCEVSPSGTGVKIFVKARLPEGATEGGVNDNEAGIEMYDKLRYFTTTGEIFNV